MNKVALTVGGLAIGGGLLLAMRGKAGGAEEPEETPGEYCCPYCTSCFTTYEELVAHVQTVHPGERIPLPIEWE